MNAKQDQSIDDLLERATKALREAPVPQGPAPEAVARVMEAALNANVDPIPAIPKKRIGNMKRIIKSAIAASILAAVGGIVSWNMIGGGFANTAFAAVAEAIDRLRSATFDITTVTNGKDDRPLTTGKGLFLAPSHHRVELSFGADQQQIIIADSQADKTVTLLPSQKFAMVMDRTKTRENPEKSANNVSPDLFETVRRLVREGSSGKGGTVEKLGKKEIDGHAAVGFRTHSTMGDMILWADPETARPVQIEISGEAFGNARLVMNNFRYDVALDPSLFSLELPAGYTSQTMSLTPPMEVELIRLLQTVAEQSKGLFPKQLGMNKEVMGALMATAKPEMDKIEAKYGGKYKLNAKHGQQLPPAVVAEVAKAITPIIQKSTQGIKFYMTLKPENDPHYVGSGVKLGAPDRPILWYKPTGDEKYRVIYADLSVKEIASDEAKKLTEIPKPSSAGN